MRVSQRESRAAHQGAFFARAPALLIAPIVLALAAAALFRAWSPGLDVTDGRHDRGRNGIWLQHGWLGADEWFDRHRKRDRIAAFRDVATIEGLATLLHQHHITDVFPHACPADSSGRLPAIDHAQAGRFLDAFAGFRVMPWVGGVEGKTVDLPDPAWRRTFVESVTDLLSQHPRFAGIHLNIEPCRSGNRHYLLLLDELRRALPADKLLSVAAYPPPAIWHPFVEVHWDQAYFRQVASRVNQMGVMLYDTALPVENLYQWLLSSWTREILAWSGPADILLGVPTYDDDGVGYHDPSVENLRGALRGVHAGLSAHGVVPDRYQGVAIYCEWETDAAEWAHWRAHFMSNQ